MVFLRVQRLSGDTDMCLPTTGDAFFGDDHSLNETLFQEIRVFVISVFEKVLNLARTSFYSATVRGAKNLTKLVCNTEFVNVTRHYILILKALNVSLESFFQPRARATVRRL